MPVLELACLRLLPGIDVLSQDLFAKFRKAKETMEAACKTGLAFHFFHCIEDPSLIYLVGNWDCVRQHMDDFVPSKANQDLLDLLKYQISVDWMFHVDLVEPAFKQYNTILKRPVVAFDRTLLKLPDDELEKVERLKIAVELEMKSYMATKEHFMCGWRTDQSSDKSQFWPDEFVTISGWETSEERIKYVKLSSRKITNSLVDCARPVESRSGIMIELEAV